MTSLRTAHFFDVGGPVHVEEYGGDPDAPVVVAVHGLSGSSAGWGRLAEALAPSARLLAVDLPGHGRSPSAGRPVTVARAVTVLGEVLRQLDRGPVTLVGHSMGAAVSALTAAAAPASVEKLLLLAPPMPRQGLRWVSPALLPHVALCLWPRLGVGALQRRMARVSIEEFVREGLRLTCAPGTELPEVAAELAAAMRATYERGEDPMVSFVEAARSIGLLVADGRRYREAISAVRAPTQVVHGAADRVLRPGDLRQLEQLQPTWATHVLPGVGHSPHLEAPDLTARLLGAPDRDGSRA